MNRVYESYLYAALALCIMPKLVISAPPFRNYDAHSGYDCPMRPRPGEKYVVNSQLSYHWCLSRPVVSENFASMTCRMQATRTGSIVGVSSRYPSSYRSKFVIRSSYGITKHRSSTIFNCEDIRQGDSIEWTDTGPSYKLYQYLCFSNASCPVATTTANHDNHNMDWFGSSWFYWGPGVMICMVVGCIFYRRHRMRQILLQRQRQQAMINDGGVNMVTTVTTTNTPTPVVAVAAHPGPEAYPVAVATAEPMPQAGAPPVAHAVAQPMGAPMAMATAVPVQATAVPAGQPQVFL